MLCSAKELGLADTSEGIVELPADAPVGTDLRAYMQLDDEIVELNVTPNRGDAMSVLGIAREVVALSKKGTDLFSAAENKSVPFFSRKPGAAHGSMPGSR
jgi:hypothetical protein